MDERRGETPGVMREGIEPFAVKRASETPTTMDHIMEEICEPENLKQALKRVRSNKGSPGPDGITVTKLPKYLRKHWLKIRANLIQGTYVPQPIKRVSIPKEGGGERLLGIPSVLDRFIQQAILQVMRVLSAKVLKISEKTE
ncbi:MAG: hypothetical protein HQM08_25160 [Candidatus Riflebacteria bacterium]|nr:hypothetical protein [Candidatus Riflebacteria bacterium]